MSSNLKTIEETRLSSDSESVNKVTPLPPDTVRAWAVVFGSFVLLMLSMGPCNAAGVLLEEYTSKVFPESPTSTISWIGTLQFGTMSFCCVFSGILMERFDTRLIVLVGSLISGSAYLIASACSSPIALIFIQGILFGIGASSLMIAGMSLPSQWLQRYRALGSGIAVAGGSVGGLWLSFATQSIVLHPSLGWRWALRITGLIIIGAGSAVCPLLKTRIPIQKREQIVDFTIFKKWHFSIWSLFTLFGCGGYFLAYSYMPPFSVEVLDKPSDWSANISSILNASSILGRVIMGFAADYAGNINSLVSSSIVSSLALLAIWLPTKNLDALIAAAAVFGFFSGTIVSLVPVATAQLFGISRLPTILGFLFIAYSIGVFACVPVAGELLDKYGSKTNFAPVILYGGVFFSTATACLVALRLSVSKIAAKV